MKVLLLRHGETEGNREKRYVGSRSDESITAEERMRLYLAGKHPERSVLSTLGNVKTIYVSPMQRCLETEQLLFLAPEFKHASVIPVVGLRECDFGAFEYKNYKELDGCPEYQRFIDSGGTEGFPGGESVTAFKKRCRDTFLRLMIPHISEEMKAQKESSQETVIFVVHGGTIMSIMEAFAKPEADYYCWHVKNAAGFLCRVETDQFHEGGFYLSLSGCVKMNFIV